MHAPRRGSILPPMIALAGAYVLGVVAAMIGGGDWWLSTILWLLAGGAVVVWRPDRALALLVVALALIAGAAHARYADLAARPAPPLAAITGTHEVSGTAREDARVTGTVARVDLTIDRIDGAYGAGGLRLTLPAREPILRGHRVTATVEIEPVAAGRGIDIADRLRAAGIDAFAAFPARWTVQPDTSAAPAARLARWRRNVVANIERALPEPAAALAAGVLVGERGALPNTVVSDLRRTGTTHLVVVSGQNIALTVGVLVGLLALVMSRRRASLLVLALLPVYVLFIGADPPVVRAAIMAVGIAIGGALGRRTPAWVYLLYAVAVMLALDPMLAMDVAFQLSASATLGVLVLAPAIRDATLARLRLSSSGLRAGSIELAATATGAALAVVPVQVAAFERLSLWTVPANVLVAPLYEATVVVGAIAAAVGWSEGASELFRPAGQLAPDAFLGVTRFVAAWPSAEVAVRAPLIAGVAWIALLAGATWWLDRQGRLASPLDPAPAGAGALIAAAVVTGGLWLLVLLPPASAARVTVLDVGQGLAVLVEDGGTRVLIDTGPPDGSLLAALGRVGADGIDAVIVTHADADHVGGLDELLRRRSVASVLAPAVTIEEARLDGARVIDIGDRLTISDRTSIEVLSPPIATAQPAHASRNNGSLVLLVSIGRRRILVPADIEAEAERWLLASGQPLTADVLVVPHHGSATSSSVALVEAVQPALAIVSVGEHNRFGHPSAAVVERYADATLLRTDHDGDVLLRSDGTELRVSTGHGRD